MTGTGGMFRCLISWTGFWIKVFRPYIKSGREMFRPLFLFFFFHQTVVDSTCDGHGPFMKMLFIFSRSSARNCSRPTEIIKLSEGLTERSKNSFCRKEKR